MSDHRIARAPESRIDQLMVHSAVSRDIIVDQTAVIDDVDGERGLLLQIRLPSYRSLPLCCIEKIGVTIDGRGVDLSTAALRIENSWHRLARLPEMIDVWWFILDTATLFVPEVAVFGRHEVAVEIVRVEPYITAGRFSFTNASTACVLVEDPTDA
jgi:hypothetical protein